MTGLHHGAREQEAMVCESAILFAACGLVTSD
jgi:poly(3-hydroxybutyrate) depolymerase